MTDDERQIIAQAIEILDRRLREPGLKMTGSETVKQFLRLSLEPDEREVFAVMFLDNKNTLIGFEKLFLGTINRVEVHPRVIAQRALQLNAAALILAHNHPSGDPLLSRSDYQLTKDIQKVMRLLNIVVLDHLVIGSHGIFSLAEKGLM
ncbi:DNA repair protein RadC [Kosakonia sp. BK9b]|uniref:JAB domain-containing protein n=1 Tax=Kosakonia sp. TaxID=1916651 RepID=UPI00289A566F|nr:DNA repair protein RadC [Kosakonia sp.]